MRLSPTVIQLLKNVTISGHLTTMPTLDRKDYAAVNQALELLGGKWDRKAKAHRWDCDPNDPIVQAIATGEISDWKKEFQFFETPPLLAKHMVATGLIGASGPGTKRRARLDPQLHQTAPAQSRHGYPCLRT